MPPEIRQALQSAIDALRATGPNADYERACKAGGLEALLEREETTGGP